MTRVTLDSVRPGDVLSYYHDSGAFGAQLCYARVERVGKRLLTLRHENGTVFRREPRNFHERVPADRWSPFNPSGRE